MSLVAPSETGKSQPAYSWLKIGNLLNKIWQNLHFLSTLATILRYFAKKNVNIDFFQGVNFVFVDSLINNGTRYLLNFDDSCGEICTSKAFIYNSAAGTHRALSAIYIEYTLLTQSTIGRDVELQNTQIVLSESPRDVMQVGWLNAQLSVGSELNSWCRDAMSVHYVHLLFSVSPRTVDPTSFCTNTGFIPWRV